MEVGGGNDQSGSVLISPGQFLYDQAQHVRFRGPYMDFIQNEVSHSLDIWWLGHQFVKQPSSSDEQQFSDEPPCLAGPSDAVSHSLAYHFSQFCSNTLSKLYSGQPPWLGDNYKSSIVSFLKITNSYPDQKRMIKKKKKA